MQKGDDACTLHRAARHPNEREARLHAIQSARPNTPGGGHAGEERANNVITFDGSPETIRTSQIARSRGCN